MTNHSPDQLEHIEGKDIRGNVQVLARSQPHQLQLFQTFLPQEEDKYSNTIEFYDAVPKYYPIKHMSPRRVGHTFLPTLSRTFEYKGVQYKLDIRPARLVHKDGIEKEYYPRTDCEFYKWA